MLYYYKRKNTLVEWEYSVGGREMYIWSAGDLNTTAEFFMLLAAGELEFIGYV